MKRLPPLPSPSADFKAGYSLVEMIVALILLGTATAIVVPALSWMNVGSRLSLQKQEAVQGLYNLMEDITLRPYDELTPESAKAVGLPETLEDQLPGAKLEVEITETEGPSKRIRMRLSWNQHGGRPLAPIRLSAWVHPKEARP